jgi:hypothetical protein
MKLGLYLHLVEVNIEGGPMGYSPLKNSSAK